MGKTFGCLTVLAEAVINSAFNNYELIHDDAEHRDNFDTEYLFGDKVADRIKPPGGYDKDGEPLNSSTVEDFQTYIYKLLKKEKPFIYVLDCMDSLDADADIKKFEDTITAREKGKTEAGTYGTGKAKANSDTLRRIKKMIRDTNSLLIVISQTRDNIGFGFAEKTRSGGRALKFYSTHEMWQTIKSTEKKSKRPIGVQSIIKIKKNSLTGKIREVPITIYYDYGVDDVGANIDWLVSEKVFKKPKNSSTITADNFGFKGSKEKLIQYIEDNNLERRLKREVQKQWDKIEDSLKSKRKRKY